MTASYARVVALLAIVAACESSSAPAPTKVQAAPVPDQAESKKSADEASKEHTTHEGGHGAGEAAGHEAGHAAGHVHTGGHHRFEDAEKWAKVFDDPERDAWQKPDLVVEWLELQPTDKVADIGAGTGYFAMRIAAKVPEGKVFGNDIEASMVEYMTKRAAKEGITNLVAVKGTAEAPALPEMVDLAFVCDVYHHIADRPAYFKGVAEKLAPEGRLVIVDFDPAAPEDAPGPPKAMRMSADQVTAELAKAGFMLSRKSTAMLPYQYMLEFKRGA